MDFLLPQDARRLPRLARALSAVAGALFVGMAAVVTAADWHSDTAFVEADRAVSLWLSTTAVAGQRSVEWREAVDSAPRAARLARDLRRIASLGDERIASLLGDLPPAPPAWFAELGDAAPSIRLALAEQLAEEERYDRCVAWIEGIEADSVFSPALLHYLQAVAWRATVDDEQSAKALEHLSDGDAAAEEDQLGAGRLWVVNALRDELAKKAEPMPGIARRMRDVERRLALSDSGDPTQERQQAILDELDKLIEKLEEQRRQQQQQAAAGSGGSQPGNAAEESRPSELKGPGEIDRKRLVSGDAWGSLPPAERERLTQAITRDYSPHYRALIEDYFRTLAAEDDPTESSEMATRR